MITDGENTTVYMLNDQTTSTAEPYSPAQIVDDWGTEEYVDALATADTSPRDVSIPVGHETQYMVNLRDKIQHLPSLASDTSGNPVNGTYAIQQSGEEMSLVNMPAILPSAPMADGNYHLKCTVSSGEATYSWEVDA